MTLVGKVMPTQISGDPENPLITGLTLSFVDAKHD